MRIHIHMKIRDIPLENRFMIRSHSLRSLPVVLLLSLCTWVPAQSVLSTRAGTTDNEALGSRLAAGADVNGDGIADLVAGAPAHDAGTGADQGRVQLLSGSNGAVLLTLVGAAVGDRFGDGAALGGDIDIDGFADLAVGAPQRDAGLGAAQGQVTVYSGSGGSLLLTLDGVTLGDGFGTAVAIIADLNSDGRAEIAVGAPGFDGSAGVDSGRVTIHSGLDGTILATIEGASAGEAFGSALANAGDVNHDGSADLVVGSPSFTSVAGASAGRVAIVSGADQSNLQVVEGTQAGAELGGAVSGASDIDNDAFLDVVAGAALYDGVGGADSGRILAISGRDGSTIFAIEGALAGDGYGSAVAGGGDVDANGFADLIVGAPGFDGSAGVDSGRFAVLSGVDGSELFAMEGLAAGDAEGSAVALPGILDGTIRAAVVSAAPQSAQGGTARGLVSLIGADTSAAFETTAYTSAAQPMAVTTCDADNDGDQDLVVVNNSSISIFWNTDQNGTTPDASFGSVARTDLSLSPGANGVSVAAGQLDADGACEIVVGRSDGSLDVFDGSSTGATSAYALSGTSPITVDQSVSPGQLAAVAIWGSGVTASVICSGAGSLSIPGFLQEVSDPLGVPTLGSGLLSGGSFQGIVIGDINGDSNDDLLVVNTSTGASGGLHILLGPGLSAATGSPFATGVTARSVALADLDASGTDDDVIVASIDFGSGGARVLPNYVDGVGFSAAVDPGALIARAVAAGNLDASGGDDVVILDGAGALIRYRGWNGLSFDTTETLDSTIGAGNGVAVSQLTQGAALDGDTEEIISAYPAVDLVNVWRHRRVALFTPVAGSGCPPGSPTALVSLSGETTIGSTDLTVNLSGASPFALCFLVATRNEPFGSTPSVSTVSGCGIASSAGELVQFSGFTDALGQATLSAGLANDPSIVDREYLLQWGVLDGGPLLGSLTISDAVVVRFGEP